MMGPKNLVLLVEGDGDVEAAPVLVKRLLKEYSAFDTLVLDESPPICLHGGFSKIRRNPNESRRHDFGEWRRFLRLAAKTRRNIGGCLLLLDGDSDAKIEEQDFCARRAARLLAAESQEVGAGKMFSLAVVFACQEFESWD